MLLKASCHCQAVRFQTRSEGEAATAREKNKAPSCWQFGAFRTSWDFLGSSEIGVLVAWGGIEGSAASRMDPGDSAYGVTFSTANLTPVRVLRNGSIATLLKNEAASAQSVTYEERKKASRCVNVGVARGCSKSYSTSMSQ